MFVPESSDLPSSHGPMRADLGVTLNRSAYGAPGSEYIKPTFAFSGPRSRENGVTFLNWAVWSQSWMRVGPLSSAKMVAVYLKTGMEWLFLLPPRGNMPMALLFFYAAQVEQRKLRKGTVPDFSTVARYSGWGYDEMKDSLDWLVGEDAETGVARFMSVSLIGSNCMRALPPAFTRPFLTGVQAPEIECGKSLACDQWCSLSCKPFWKIVREARTKSWPTIVRSVPKCSRCPGLLGVMREAVPTRNRLIKQSIFFPQCLPFRSADGELWNDPFTIQNVQTPAPTFVPTASPIHRPSKAPTDRPTNRPSKAPTLPTSRPTRKKRGLQHELDGSGSEDVEEAEAQLEQAHSQQHQDLLDPERDQRSQLLQAMYMRESEGRTLWKLPDIDVLDMLHDNDPRRRELVGSHNVDDLRRQLRRELLNEPVAAASEAKTRSDSQDDEDFADCVP
jgi:hypothetical protein